MDQSGRSSMAASKSTANDTAITSALRSPAHHPPGSGTNTPQGPLPACGSLSRVCDQALGLIVKACLGSTLGATNLPVTDKIDLEVRTLRACLQTACHILLAGALCCRV